MLGCSVALTLSVWLARAHEVMLVVFAAWTLWILALPIWRMMSPGWWAPYWLQGRNPFWLTMAPYSRPGRPRCWSRSSSCSACLLISAGLAALSVARVRPVYLAQSCRTPKPPRVRGAAGWLRRRARCGGPARRSTPTRSSGASGTRTGRRGGSGASGSSTSRWPRCSACKVSGTNLSNPAVGRGEMALFLNAFLGLVGLLLLSASAATVLSEERVRGSLDVLLSTPISTRSIVRGKWWGAFRRAPWLAFWPGAGDLLLLRPDSPPWKVPIASLVPALIIAQAAALASLGLALATWIPRAGRAVTWTVTALVASVIGWPVLGFLLSATGGQPNDPHDAS